MKTIKLVGHIKTKSPVTVTIPEVIGMPRNSHGDAYLPASSLRGWLRHIAVEALIELLNRKSKEPLSVDEIYMLASGVDTAQQVSMKGNGEVAVGKNIELRKDNPFLSLFGRWGLAGKLAVGNALAQRGQDVIVDVGGGARSHVFKRNQELVSFIDPAEVSYLQDILEADAISSADMGEIKAKKADIKKLFKNADKETKAELNAQMAQLTLQENAVKDARKGARETVQRPLESFEAIDSGVELSHTITLNNPTELELDCLLWILAKATSNLSVGGHKNLGCGDIECEWTLQESSFETMTSTALGYVKLTDQSLETNLNVDLNAFESKVLNKEVNITRFI